MLQKYFSYLDAFSIFAVSELKLSGWVWPEEAAQAAFGEAAVPAALKL